MTRVHVGSRSSKSASLGLSMQIVRVGSDGAHCLNSRYRYLPQSENTACDACEYSSGVSNMPSCRSSLFVTAARPIKRFFGQPARGMGPASSKSEADAEWLQKPQRMVSVVPHVGVLDSTARLSSRSQTGHLQPLPDSTRTNSVSFRTFRGLYCTVSLLYYLCEF